MASSWAMEEMRDVNLHDRRLNDRLREVLSQLGDHPTASIPAACGGMAEMSAAYRLFDNPKVVWEEILRPHEEATRRRIAAQPTVILAQDTTEIDLTRPEQQVAGAGPLDGGARRGLFLHPLVAFTPDGTPLGTVHAAVWAREESSGADAAERRLQRRKAPIEGKESRRWVEGLRRCREEARRAPHTRFVCVADSEADLYELLVEAQAPPREMDWIVRACQDRAVAGTDSRLREELSTRAVLFRRAVKVRGRKALIGCEDRSRRQSRRSRVAEVSVRAAEVTLEPPARAGAAASPVRVNVVWVLEERPPANEPAVEWLLLTNRPVGGAEEARAVVEMYGVRWMEEVFFRTLKSGCRVEKRRFERVERVLPCLAVYLIVAWRTLFVCRVSRALPEISCEAIFEPSEWKSLHAIVKRTPPPSAPPTLGEVVRMVGELGGYVPRGGDSAPGPQTTWLGLQRLHDISLCWDVFGPEARRPRKDV